MAERHVVADRHLGAVARGASLGLVGSAVSAVSTFGLVLVVARSAAVTDSGVFFAATALFLVLLGLTGLGAEAGLARLGMRLAHEERPAQVRALFTHVRRVVLVVALVVAAAVALLAPWAAQPLGWGDDGVTVVRLVALALPFAVVAELAQAATRAFGRMQETVWFDRTLRPVIQVAAVAVAGGAGAGALGLTAAWVACYPVLALLSGWRARHYLRARFPAAGTRDPSDSAGTPAPGAPAAATVPVREFWSFTWPRALAVVARLTIQKVDVILVAALLSPGHAALYTVATRFVALGQAVSMAITQVLQPRFAALLLERSPEALSRTYQTSTGWSMLLAWPLYLAVAAAPEGYLRLFGAEYVVADGAQVAMAMAAAMLVSAATGPVDVLLVMAGRSFTSMVNAWLALVVNVLLCLVLIPWIGVVGAALAWGAAVLTKSMLAALQVHAEVQVSTFSRAVLLAALVPGVSVVLPVTVLTTAGIGWLPAVAVAALCYGAAVAIARRPLQVDLLIKALGTRRTT